MKSDRNIHEESNKKNSNQTNINTGPFVASYSYLFLVLLLSLIHTWLKSQPQKPSQSSFCGMAPCITIQSKVKKIHVSASPPFFGPLFLKSSSLYPKINLSLTIVVQTIVEQYHKHVYNQSHIVKFNEILVLGL